MGLSIGFGIGINYGTDQGDNTPQPPVGGEPTTGILLENNDFLLAENGDYLIQE